MPLLVAKIWQVLTVLKSHLGEAERKWARFQSRTASNFRLRISLLLLFSVINVAVGAVAYRWVTAEGWSDALFTVYAVLYGIPGSDVTNAPTFWGTVVLNLIFIFGLLVFATILAMITEEVNNLLLQARSGKQPLALAGHILLLNWNNQVPFILDQLEQVQEGHPFAGRPVVILAERSKEEMDALVVSFLKKQHLEVHTRTGKPFKLDHLQRVSARDAHAVLVLQPEASSEGDASDASSSVSGMGAAAHSDSPGAAALKVQTVMALTSQLMGNKQTAVVVQVPESSNNCSSQLQVLDQVLSMSGHPTHLMNIPVKRMVNSLAVQTTLQPWSASIYHSILQYGLQPNITFLDLPESLCTCPSNVATPGATSSGNDFGIGGYGARATGDFRSTTFEAVRVYFASELLLLGFVRKQQLVLNPADATVLTPGDVLVALSNRADAAVAAFSWKDTLLLKATAQLAAISAKIPFKSASKAQDVKDLVTDAAASSSSDIPVPASATAAEDDEIIAQSNDSSSSSSSNNMNAAMSRLGQQKQHEVVASRTLETVTEARAVQWADSCAAAAAAAVPASTTGDHTVAAAAVGTADAMMTADDSTQGTAGLSLTTTRADNSSKQVPATDAAQANSAATAVPTQAEAAPTSTPAAAAAACVTAAEAGSKDSRDTAILKVTESCGNTSSERAAAATAAAVAAAAPEHDISVSIEKADQCSVAKGQQDVPVTTRAPPAAAVTNKGNGGAHGDAAYMAVPVPAAKTVAAKGDNPPAAASKSSLLRVLCCAAPTTKHEDAVTPKVGKLSRTPGSTSFKGVTKGAAKLGKGVTKGVTGAVSAVTTGVTAGVAAAATGVTGAVMTVAEGAADLSKTVVTGAVSTVADGAVSLGKVAAGAVTTVADGAMTLSKGAVNVVTDGAKTVSKGAIGAVTSMTGAVTGAVTSTTGLLRNELLRAPSKRSMTYEVNREFEQEAKPNTWAPTSWVFGAGKKLQQSAKALASKRLSRVPPAVSRGPPTEKLHIVVAGFTASEAAEDLLPHFLDFAPPGSSVVFTVNQGDELPDGVEWEGKMEDVEEREEGPPITHLINYKFLPTSNATSREALAAAGLLTADAVLLAADEALRNNPAEADAQVLAALVEVQHLLASDKILRDSQASMGTTVSHSKSSSYARSASIKAAPTAGNVLGTSAAAGKGSVQLSVADRAASAASLQAALAGEQIRKQKPPHVVACVATSSSKAVAAAFFGPANSAVSGVPCSSEASGASDGAANQSGTVNASTLNPNNGVIGPGLFSYELIVPGEVEGAVLTQVANEPQYVKVVTQLLASSEGCELYLLSPASFGFTVGEELAFAEVQEVGRLLRKTTLGVVASGEVLLLPDPAWRWTVAENDKIAAIAASW